MVPIFVDVWGNKSSRKRITYSEPSLGSLEKKTWYSKVPRLSVVGCSWGKSSPQKHKWNNAYFPPTPRRGQVTHCQTNRKPCFLFNEVVGFFYFYGWKGGGKKVYIYISINYVYWHRSPNSHVFIGDALSKPSFWSIFLRLLGGYTWIYIKSRAPTHDTYVQDYRDKQRSHNLCDVFEVPNLASL